MNNKLKTAYACAFLALCAAPLALLPFFGADGASENRNLSEMPAFTNEDGSANLEWSSQFETYFSEHFALRPQLVTLDSMIKSRVFKTSSVEKVVVGSDGWLYYAQTLPDYTGSGAMSERGIYRTAKTLSLLSEHFEDEGRSFLFLCAPNKSTVCPEHMPARYIRSSAPSNLERLSRQLDKAGVDYIDLVPLLVRQDDPLYLERDSHWTNEGALIAYNAAADALGIEHDDFSGAAHSSQRVWHADLDGMLFPSLEVLSDQEIYDISFSFEYRGAFTGEDDILIRTAGKKGGAPLLMYRDSFGRAFYPYAAENSEKAYFSREMPYKTSLADDAGALCVIAEIAERNLKTLTRSAPLMNAPMRSLEFSTSVSESEENFCEVSQRKSSIRLYGALDPSYFESDSDIYVTLETPDIAVAYEAFPIYEAELLGSDEDSDYGFSLTADTTDIPPGTYDVFAYVSAGDTYTCTESLAQVTVG